MVRKRQDAKHDPICVKKKNVCLDPCIFLHNFQKVYKKLVIVVTAGKLRKNDLEEKLWILFI